jgi:hypothetical protein
MTNYAIKASTQEHLDIYTIKNDIIVNKDGSCAVVLETNAINFDLLSEDEQSAVMYAYAGLLNSLSFPIELLIRSQRKDISSYLELLDNRIQQTTSQKVKESVIRYRRFVKSLVKERRVLEKQFYLVIPFTSIELGISVNTLNPFAKRPNKPAYDLDYVLEKAALILNPRRDHLIRQFARIGLKSRQLGNQELISLFHKIYNSSPLHQISSSTSPFIETNTIVTEKPEVAKKQSLIKSIFNRDSTPTTSPPTPGTSTNQNSTHA